jgi:hypothetical protein
VYTCRSSMCLKLADETVKITIIWHCQALLTSDLQTCVTSVQNIQNTETLLETVTSTLPESILLEVLIGSAAKSSCPTWKKGSEYLQNSSISPQKYKLLPELHL